MGRELINNLKEENKKLLSIISMFKVNGLNLENLNDSISKDKVELNQFDYIIEKSALNYKNQNPHQSRRNLMSVYQLPY